MANRRGYEALAVNPVPLDHACAARRPTSSTRAKARLGPGARARRTARLPQRADHRGRADRHHRPRDGLRHHRHRARLRAGEVQEARRRRLLQDHQPRRARGAARARLPRKRDRRDRGLCRRPRLARPTRPASTSRPCKAKGFTDEAIAKVEKALPTAFDIKFAFNKWTLRRGLPHATRSKIAGREAIDDAELRPARRCSASPSARSRPPTSTSAAR